MIRALVLLASLLAGTAAAEAHALRVFAMTSIGLAMGVTVSHAASNEISKLAQNLTVLRGEVESLSDQLEQQKNETRAKLRSLTAQEMDLDMQVQKESLRLKQLELAREKHLAEVRSGDKARGQLRPVILDGIERIGITAGASAPEVLVEEVIEALAAHYTISIDTVNAIDEDVFFPLPRPLRPDAAAE